MGGGGGGAPLVLAPSDALDLAAPREEEGGVEVEVAEAAAAAGGVEGGITIALESPKSSSPFHFNNSSLDSCTAPPPPRPAFSFSSSSCSSSSTADRPTQRATSVCAGSRREGKWSRGCRGSRGC